MRGALDAEIVRLGGARREYNLLGGGADEIRDLRPRGLDGGFGFPSVGMGAGMGIAVRSDLARSRRRAGGGYTSSR